MLHACSYTICLAFCYTLWRFDAFSGTNLLTRCHSVSFLVSVVFFVSEKLHRKYSQNWTKQKPNLIFFTEASRRPKMTRRGARGQPHHHGARPSPWPRPPMVRAPWSTPDDAPSPIKSPRREKPRGRIAFCRNILQAAAIAVARLGGSRSSSRHPAGEGNPCRRPSTPPWSPPE
jgi:hypothetical protein